jgi:hypothetical protein
MDRDAELAGMDAEQLKEALRQAELLIEDVQEERDFTLGQTGVHIGANELERLRRAWQGDETRLQERIAAISARLAGLQSGPDPGAS